MAFHWRWSFSSLSNLCWDTFFIWELQHHHHYTAFRVQVQVICQGVWLRPHITGVAILLSDMIVLGRGEGIWCYSNHWIGGGGGGGT